MKSLICLSAFLFSLNVFNSKAADPFLDTSLSLDVRVKDLISKMTLDEKISQLGNQAAAITRLGVKSYNYWSEALHGVARQGLATSFPQPIGMSATWDPELIFRIATATSDEARVKNNMNGTGLTYWCPVVNMARDPRWGRSEENFGEDTYLASQMAVNFIKGMQGNDPKYLKTVATAKHFACNNVENSRYTISSNVDERSLREYFLPTFKACVTEGKVYSIMSAYNAVNGVPSPANRTLLKHILRDEWGFKGFVVSDCDAVACVYAAHRYVTTGAAATAISIRNGTDINCGNTYQDYANIAVSNGLLTEANIDSALTNVFKARFLLGEFDPPASVPYTSIPNSILDCDVNRNLALEAAREAIVLLKNSGSILPLNKDSIHSIAVIGPNANICQLGEYSGSPSVQISPLQGIKEKMGIAEFTISAASYSHSNGTIYTVSGSEVIEINQNGSYTSYDSIDFGKGKTKVDISVASRSSGGTINIALDNVNGPVIATFSVPVTGGWQTTLSQNVDTVKGKHNVFLKFSGSSGFSFFVGWFRFYNSPDTVASPNTKVVNYVYGTSVNFSQLNQPGIDSAINVAKKSDVAILVCGTDIETGREDRDRNDITLPGLQEQLIKAVFHANPKTILVLVNGFSLAINWEQDSIPAILTAWFDGQSQGTAIADVLFGDYNPGGKLSTTWYKSISDLPPMNDYNIKNNRTYMYFKGKPLYPFGHGLSYTTFEYSGLTLNSKTLNPGDTIIVSANVKNTGQITGNEVVQLYAHVNSSLIRPIKELKGFRRISLLPGETKTVSFSLKFEDLQYYDVTSKTFMVESGNVDLYIGSSSADIRLQDQISVSADTVSSTYRQNPFNIIQSEFFENKSKTVTIKPCEEICTDSLVNESYIVFKNFDFKEEAKQFAARIYSVKNGNLEIVLDSLNGAIAGTLLISPTENNNFETKYCDLSGITGLHDIYLVFKGGNSSICKLNWFSFQKNKGDIVVGVNDKKEENNFSIYPNPSGNNISVNYYLGTTSNVKIDIFNQQGIIVKSFFFNQQNEGTHQFNISAYSLKMQSGIYFVRFTTNTFTKSEKLVIVR